MSAAGRPIEMEDFQDRRSLIRACKLERQPSLQTFTAIRTHKNNQPHGKSISRELKAISRQTDARASHMKEGTR